MSHHFNEVLLAIISLVDMFLIQPDGCETPPEIKHNSNFMSYFKVKKYNFDIYKLLNLY